MSDPDNRHLPVQWYDPSLDVWIPITQERMNQFQSDLFLMKDRIRELEAALHKITATTYGSELNMSKEEHNEYFAQFYSQYREIARKVLKKQ